jgi:DNA-binding transcriptional regulator LsrR (DeoR family)
VIVTIREQKKLSLLAEVACDYYERSLNQNQIAERLCLSRTRVSRLLKEAWEKGVIKITINYTFERHYELEYRLKSRFGLKDVRILNNRGRSLEIIQHDVGHLAAEYLMENLKEDMIIGTSWGTTLAETLKCFQHTNIAIEVIQLVGSVPCKTPNCTPQEIAASLADILGGHADFLNLPLFIENNSKVLAKGAYVDLVLTSISDITRIRENKFWHEYMNDLMYEEICNKGAAGSIFARFFDQDGMLIDCAWNKKCVAISFEDIKTISNVVVVASSRSKAKAVLSAMRGGLITTSITDATTATEILRCNEYC